MPYKSALKIIISIIVVCLSVYNIFVLAMTPSSSFLMLNYYFWFWTILAWISVYLIIRNYLVLSESLE